MRIDKDHTTKQGGAGVAASDGDRRSGRERCAEGERGVKTKEECGSKMSENRKRSIWMHFDSCVNSCPILISMSRFL